MVIEIARACHLTPGVMRQATTKAHVRVGSPWGKEQYRATRVGCTENPLGLDTGDALSR